MRLLRLDFRDPKATLDIHPLLTIISAQDSAIVAPLFAALRRLSRGETVGLRGLIQHEGLLFELTPALDRPLGVVSTSAAVLLPVDAVPPNINALLRSEAATWNNQAAFDEIVAEDLRANHLSSAAQIEAADREAKHSAARLRYLNARVDRLASNQPAQSEREVLEPIAEAVSQLATEISGSTPVAVVGSFSNLGQDGVFRIFETLCELARKVQLIVITDNSDAARWAQAAGPKTVMVSNARSPAARPVRAKR